MSTRLFDLPWGFVESYDDNELAIVSTITDPPKIRIAVDADKVESNLGAVSFNLRRSDGRHEEYAYVMGRLTADRQGGAVYIGTRAPGESQVRERLYMDHTAAIFSVPLVAPNLTSGGGTGQGRFYSGGGRFCFNVQDDTAWPRGALIVYDTHMSTDEATWTAVGKMVPGPL